MELKSCPFCGGDGSVSFEPKSEIIFGCCWDCGARGPAFKCSGWPTENNLSDAVEEWNRRADNV